jgi:hypothetical protein
MAIDTPCDSRAARVAGNGEVFLCNIFRPSVDFLLTGNFDLRPLGGLLQIAAMLSSKL